MFSAGDQGKMLEGLRVIDMTSVVFGPYATQVLADLGAEVIKVEAPGGDIFRRSTPAKNAPGMGPSFMAINRGKQSIVLDLKLEEDAEVMRELLKSADIFIHNVRMEGMKRIGFDHESVRVLAPDLIYVHCMGFGSGGPYAKLQAYDDVIQAASGTASLLPRVDGNPNPRFLPSLLADKVAGLTAVYATQAALIHRMRTGEAQFVKVPMFEAFSRFMLQEHLGGHFYAPPNGEVGYGRQLEPHRQPFPASDGYICLVPYKMQQWHEVFEIVGEPDFVRDQGYETDLEIRAGQPVLYSRLRELTPANTKDHWIREFRARNIPCMAVRDLADMLDEPHLNAVGFFKRREHPTEGTINDVGEACQFSAWAPDDDPLPCPTLDEHGETLRAAMTKRSETAG